MIIDMNKSQHEMDVASLWLPIDTKIQTVSEVSKCIFFVLQKGVPCLLKVTEGDFLEILLRK